MLTPGLTAALVLASLEPVAEGPAQEAGLAPLSSDTSLAPDLDRERRLATWTAERRRLRLHTGLSGAFAGVMLVTGVVLMVGPDGCDHMNCGQNLGRLFAGIGLTALAIIPISTGIYWGVRLHRHGEVRPTAVLRPGPGGFALQF